MVMKTIQVPGILYECSASPKREGYSVLVNLDVDDHERNISYTLISGPRGWPATGDYKLIYSHGGQQHEARGHFDGKTWQQANFGAV